MKTSDLLKQAYATLSEGPHKWTKATFARGDDGKATSSDDQYAVCFCGLGAVLHRAHRNYKAGYEAAYKVSGEAERKLDLAANGSWVEFNDDPYTTYEEMLAKYREAIELAEADERITLNVFHSDER